MKKVALTFVTAMLVALCGQALAQGSPKGNSEAAKSKITLCIGCHGLVGYKTAFPAVYHVPMIGGQSADYLTKALLAYRAGDRNHPSMRAVAQSLSDQDIADLAAYYGMAK